MNWEGRDDLLKATPAGINFYWQTIDINYKEEKWF